MVTVSRHYILIFPAVYDIDANVLQTGCGKF